APTGLGAAIGAAPAGFTLPSGPWPEVRTYLVPLSAPRRANVALTDASLAPAEAGGALAVSALSFGGGAGDLAVDVHDLADQSELGGGFVSLPDRGEGSTLLPLSKMPAEGGAATIPDDALALDNRRVFAAGRAGTLRVLVREDGPPSAVAIALGAGSPA